VNVTNRSIFKPNQARNISNLSSGTQFFIIIYELIIQVNQLLNETSTRTFQINSNHLYYLRSSIRLGFDLENLGSFLHTCMYYFFSWQYHLLRVLAVTRIYPVTSLCLVQFHANLLCPLPSDSRPLRQSISFWGVHVVVRFEVFPFKNRS